MEEEIVKNNIFLYFWINLKFLFNAVQQSGIKI